MSDKKRESIPVENHTPDFKLQVVLAYIQDPKRKKQILKENGMPKMYVCHEPSYGVLFVPAGRMPARFFARSYESD